jgi:hypothetical protein
MPQTASPFRDGFAALWHEKALLPAELVWRWAFGFSAITLGLISIGLFLDSLKVSAVDQLMLRTLQPKLLDSALRHILTGSLARFVLMQAVLILGMTLLWALAATAGRAATLRRLVAMFSSEEDSQEQEWAFVPILTLQLMRAAWSLTALAVSGGLFVYGVVLAQQQHALRAAGVLSLGVGLACFAGIVLQWYFSVAPVFCVRNRAGAMEALDQAAGFSSRNPGRLLLLAAGFLGLRLLWAGTMCFAVLSPLSVAAALGPRWVMLVIGVVAVVYFAGADLLRLAHLGAYVSLAEDDSRPVDPLEPATPTSASGSPIEILPMEGLA